MNSKEMKTVLILFTLLLLVFLDGYRILVIIFGFIALVAIERTTGKKEELYELEKKRNEVKNKEEEFEANKNKRLELFKKDEADISALIEQYIRTLYVKYTQTIIRDDYGNFFYDKWFQEMDYFIENVIMKDTNLSGYLHASLEKLEAIGVRYDEKEAQAMQAAEELSLFRISETRKKIIAAVAEYELNNIENSSNLAVDVDSLDPIQFEHFCADILRKSGWNARVTQASSDQGIDVIANRGNIKAVFQCKKYSQPVGNGAVQEIIAGKQFEQAHIAAVVSNNSYTKSAKQLASTAGVYLLHHHELHQFAQNWGSDSDNDLIPDTNDSPKKEEGSTGQHVIIGKDSMPMVCPSCQSNIQYLLDDLPHKGKEKELSCPVCSVSMSMKMRDQDYSCQGCGLYFDNMKDKFEHHKACAILKEKLFTCKGCNREKILDDSEFDELTKNWQVKAACSCGFETEIIKNNYHTQVNYGS